jgi:hypothetical protein
METKYIKNKDNKQSNKQKHTIKYNSSKNIQR